LLENFDKVIHCFSKLKPEFKDAITDTCRRMGKGMADFLDLEIVTLLDLERYAHCASSLVFQGLSRIWITSGLGHFPSLYEDYTLNAQGLHLINGVGAFFQKVHIIQGLVEDLNEIPPRVFWPREVWSKYADKIEDLIPSKKKINNFNEEKSIACLNELAVSSVQHIPDCMAYLKAYESRSSDTSVFRLMGGSILMFIASLELIYDNAEVLRGKVRIPKTEALRIMQKTETYPGFVEMLLEYVDRIISKAECISLQRRDFDCSAKMVRQMLETKKRGVQDLSEAINDT